MVRLYIKYNKTGEVSEYGTSPHDALILREDGSLHYINLQTGMGTEWGGYSFCNDRGGTPTTYDDKMLVDIGGEYYEAENTVGSAFRSMGDKEIADWLGDHMDCAYCPKDIACALSKQKNCKKVLLDWIKEPWNGGLK